MENNIDDNPQKTELDAAAGQLIDSLEKVDKGIKNYVLRCYLEKTGGVSGGGDSAKGEKAFFAEEEKAFFAEEEKAYNYFLDNSVIMSAMASSHGTSVFTEYLYNGLPDPSIIDNYVLQCRAGKAVKARLEAIEEKLPAMINNRLGGQNKVLIGNFGSGPGRDIINVLSKNFRGAENVRAVNIDRDTAALRRGSVMAEARGIGGMMDFVPSNFLKFACPEKFDILLLVGVLCPLDFETCVMILEKLRPMLKQDGIIVASNASKTMESGDPFAYHIMNWVADWKLVFKNEEMLKKIFEASGFCWKGCFSDSYGYHLMGMAGLA